MATTEMVLESRHFTANGPVAEMRAIALKRRKELVAALRQVDELLEYLDTMDSVPRSADDAEIPPMAPGRYKGKKLSPAFETYLRDRRGLKIPLKRAVEDMVLSGATLGESHTPEHQLKIIVSRRPSLVEFDHHSQTLWLAESALLPPKKRIRKKS